VAVDSLVVLGIHETLRKQNAAKGRILQLPPDSSVARMPKQSHMLSWILLGLGKIQSFDLGGIFIATAGAIVLLGIYRLTRK